MGLVNPKEQMKKVNLNLGMGEVGGGSQLRPEAKSLEKSEVKSPARTAQSVLVLWYVCVNGPKTAFRRRLPPSCATRLKPKYFERHESGGLGGESCCKCAMVMFMGKVQDRGQHSVAHGIRAEQARHAN